MPTLTEEQKRRNVYARRCRKVAKAIRQEPDHFYMGSFFQPGLHSFVDLPAEERSVGVSIHTCGTTACIGGWVATLYLPRALFNAWDDVDARRLLGLSRIETDAGFEDWGVGLFYNMNLGPQGAAEALDRIAYGYEQGTRNPADDGYDTIDAAEDRIKKQWRRRRMSRTGVKPFITKAAFRRGRDRVLRRKGQTATARSSSR